MLNRLTNLLSTDISALPRVFVINESLQTAQRTQRLMLSEQISNQMAIVSDLQRSYRRTTTAENSAEMIEQINQATEALRNLTEVYEVLR